VSLSENSSPPWCLKLVTGLSFCLKPLVAVGPRNNVSAGPPLIAPEPVTQTLSCELNLIETLQLRLFLKHSHTVALICNVASHDSNKWTFIFNTSTVASLSTQHYGAKPSPQQPRTNFVPPVKMCWTYFKTIGHRPVTTGSGAKPPLQTFSPPMENYVGHSWKLLDIVWKIWVPLRKLFAPPGVQSWLRAWAKPSDALAFLTNNRDVTVDPEMVIVSCSKWNADWILSFNCARRYVFRKVKIWLLASPDFVHMNPLTYF